MIERKSKKATRTKEWILPMILFCIPIVSFISMGYFVIDKTNKNRSNWAKVALVISVVLHLAFLIVLIRLHNMPYSEFYDMISKFKK